MQSLLDGLDATRRDETYRTHSQSHEEPEGSPAVGHDPAPETSTSPRSDLAEKDRHTPIRRIEIGSIDIPPEWRKIKKSVVTQLADSLQREGLLHPIGVRFDEEMGRYVLVFGRHRLEAARKAGWTEIPATVLPSGMSPEFYASMTGAENLFRVELPAAERVLALKRWQAGYAEEHPGVGSASERGRAGAEVTNKKLGRKKKAQEQPQGDEAAPAVEAEPSSEQSQPKIFVEHACEATGMDRKTVERYLYSGKNLGEDQLMVLAQANVAHEHVKKINKLEPEQIRTVVSLVAAGAGAKEAIAEATLPPGATTEVVGDPESPRPEEELSDEEWVQQQCGEVLDRLKYQAVYKTDAILYRQTRDARTKLRNVAKKPLAQARLKTPGPFHFLLAKLVNTDHPKNWLPCGPCGSTGMSGDNSKCGTCFGHGYLIKKESR